MSAALSRPVPLTQIETVAVWRAQAGAFLLLGQAAGPVPKAGSARTANSLAGVGVFRAEFWPTAGDAGFTFLAVVRLSGSSDPAPNTELVFRGARNGDREFRLQLVPASREAEFGTLLARYANGQGAKLVHFLFDVMRPDDHAEDRRPHRLIESFLKSAARSEGCVELILNVPGQGVLLQGWGVRHVEPIDILLFGGGRTRFPIEACEFPRDDIQAPATGTVFALPADAIEGLVGVETVFLLTGTEILCRQVVEPRVLSALESVGQIRHLLPRLICLPPLLERLRELARPGYDGCDTLNSSPRPVRAALDIAIWRADAGVYLSGWLFDPTGQVARIDFASEDAQTRIDVATVRIPREDVSAAFHADPHFPVSSSNEWGFVVSTTHAPEPEATTYLRFTFNDGEIAFLPIRGLCAREPSRLQALIDGVDLHKPSGLVTIESHLAPFIARCRPEPDVSAAFAVTGPSERPRAIVVPLRSPVLPRALIANFIAGGSFPDEQLVFVCGPDWTGRPLEMLASLIRFYELPASVVVLGRDVRSLSAMQAAVQLTQAGALLLVSDLAGDIPGEVRSLLFESARDCDVLCPTILYEDRSIRFAGTANVEYCASAPYAQENVSCAGFAASLVRSDEVRPMTGGTLACSVIRSSAVPLLITDRVFLTEACEEVAVFDRAKRSNLRCAWIGSVQVTVPEEPVCGVSNVSKLVDGWTLRAMASEEATCGS